MFLIEVTRGTRTGQIYASKIQGRADADRMREAARHYGYKDAKVRNEKHFQEEKAKRTRRPPGPAKARS